MRRTTRLSAALFAGLALVGTALSVPTIANAGSAGKGSTSANVSGPDARMGTAKQDTWVANNQTAKVAPASAFASLRTKAVKRGDVRVVVGLRTSQTAEGALSKAQVSAQRGAIARATNSVKSALAGTKHAVTHTYTSVPYIALRMSPAALDKLRASGLAASLQEDTFDKTDLLQSTEIVEARESWFVGRNGAGQNVAILDTGVDKAHPFLKQGSGASKVVSEACYAANSTCPGGVAASTAVGSGVPCVGTSACFHGTHVAGIAAGRGSAFHGVAKESNLLAIRVFSVFNTPAQCGGAPNCAGAFTSDQIAGLQRVYDLRNTFAIASANMSLGSTATTAVDCDADSRKAIIDNLRSVGIATVIASGNSSSTTGVSTPACISTAIAVGSTTKTDTVSSFSNSSNQVELLAPGSSINSSVPGGGFGVASGTSMAAPHVAGAWAVLNQVNNAVTVPTALSALQTTGKPITDTRNNIVKPRIKLLGAGTRLADTGLRTRASFAIPGLDVTSDGIGLATRAGGPSAGTLSIAGVPVGSTVYRSYLTWTTIGGPDASVVFRGSNLAGTLVGASADTNWFLNNLSPNRTYLAAVSIPGNGNYTISGVGGVAGAQGQGASLVVLYRTATGVNGKVYIRFGASTSCNPANTASTTLFTTGNGVHSRRPALHVGVGDGQAFTEAPLKFNGVAVTAPDFYNGGQGPMWDDDRIEIPSTLIPAGSASRPLVLNGIGDCLVMSYAAVSYRTTG